jgi:hypothetical protein
VTRGLGHTRDVWPHHGAVWLGQGVSRVLGYGQQAGDSSGGVSLVSKALPHRDLFRRPDKPRFPYAYVAYSRPPASFSVMHSGVFSLYLACLLRCMV